MLLISASIQDLRWLADVYEQAQKTRKALKNRARAKNQEADKHGGAYADELGDRFYELEKDIYSQMKKVVRDMPIYTEWLSKVKGIGPTYTTKLLAWIDIEKADTISALWKYCGYGVEMVCENCGAMEPRKPLRKNGTTDEEYEQIIAEYEREKRIWQGINDGDPCPKCGQPVHGEAQKKRRGMPTGYNPQVKSLLWNIGTNFLKNNSPYRKIYEQEKARKQKEGWGENDGHRHLHAMRKMVKVFLSHLWVKWREIEGLPTREPYVIEYTKHTDYYMPEEFVS